MKRATLRAIIACFVLCGITVPVAYNYLARKAEVHMTVFVHGSIFSALSVLNVSKVIKDELPDDALYVKTIAHVRKYEILEQDQVLQQEGFHPLNRLAFDFNGLSDRERKMAACHVVPAYLACADLAHEHVVDHVAYTFGHLGLLSANYRKQVAEEFYDSLVKEIITLQSDYRTVVVNVVTHSHGGNIALNLAHWERQKGYGLTIDNLIMLGCPIQQETVSLAYDPVFTHVFNCYSDGDMVQNADTLSTQGRRSYSKLSDNLFPIERPINCNVWDIRLLVNNDRKRIDHANMWLMGLSKKACDTLDPLPIAVLLPTIIKHTKGSLERDVDCNIMSTKRQVQIQLRPYDNQMVIAQSENLRTHAKRWNKAVVASWDPDYTSRNVMFNFKIRRALYDALKDWWIGDANNAH